MGYLALFYGCLEVEVLKTNSCTSLHGRLKNETLLYIVARFPEMLKVLTSRGQKPLEVIEARKLLDRLARKFDANFDGKFNYTGNEIVILYEIYKWFLNFSLKFVSFFSYTYKLYVFSLPCNTFDKRKFKGRITSIREYYQAHRPNFNLKNKKTGYQKC